MFSAPAPVTKSGDRLHELVRAIGEFGTDLMSVVGNTAANIVVSPFSAATAMQMVWQGAVGETSHEMARALHMADAADTAHTQHELTSTMLASLPDEAVALNIANTMWVQDGLRLGSGFSTTLREDYAADPYSVDFVRRPETCREEINRLIAEQTANRITDLLGPGTVNVDTRLVLANATYLKLHWGDAFAPESTTTEPFQLADGGTVTVPMMHRKAEFGYARRDGYQSVSMSDSTRQLAMTVVLPDGPIAELEALVRRRGLGTVLSGLRPIELTLDIPRFRYHGTHPLVTALQELGIRRAFDGIAAEFTGITRDERLYVSHVVQGVDLTVDEQGAEAAAATAVAITAVSLSLAPSRVTIDRPFLFAVTHTGTGVPLLFGRISDPSRPS